LFSAGDIIREAAEKAGLSPHDAALRWIAHHSKLSAEHGDQVIIGSSTLTQLTDNINSTEGGALPVAVVEAFEKAWEIAKPAATPYYM
jgi:aflatoxin B1 aldehyde reductase